MKHWSDIPFLRITASFILGAWLQRFTPAVELNALVMPGVAAMCGLGFLLISRIRITSRPVLSLITVVGFILLGFLSALLTTVEEKPAAEFMNQLSGIEYYTAKITGSPEKTARSVRYKARIENVLINDHWTVFEKDAIIYIKETSTPLRYGDMLLIDGSLTLTESNKNPNAFDYALYLQRKGIWMQGFAFSYHLLPDNSLPSVFELASQSADFLDEQLIKYIPEEREQQVARAMILGRRNEVSPEMDFAYQSTGTSHILAVSGMHVGVIYLTLSFLLGFLKYGRFRVLYFAIMLAGVWSFAFITGLSPSVLRAAVMFSVFLIARLIGRDSNIYNSLFISAFFILLFSPALIYSVSLQLSYLAVFGIVYLYKPIYGWVRIKNPVINFFWKITALSIAAQVATFPVTIYYFHQFPTLFMITNLFAIPTSSVVMIGGMVLLVLSAFEPVPILLGKLLSVLITAYNDILLFFSKLSITAVEDLQIKIPVVFLLILLVVFLVRAIETKQLVYFRFFTITLVVTLSYAAMDFYRINRQIIITCYNTREGSVCDVFLGQACYSIGNSPDEEMRYSVLPNRQYHGINKVYPLSELPVSKSTTNANLLVIGGKSVLLLKGPIPGSLPMKIDVVLLQRDDIAIPADLDYGLVVFNRVPGKSSVINTSKTHVISDQGAWRFSL